MVDDIVMQGEAEKAEKEKKKENYVSLQGGYCSDREKLIQQNDDFLDEKSQDEVFSGKKGGYLETLKAALKKVHETEIELFRKANCKKNIKVGKEIIEVYVGPDKQEYANIEDWQNSFRTYLLSKAEMQEPGSSTQEGMSYSHEKGKGKGDDQDDQSRYEHDA